MAHLVESYLTAPTIAPSTVVRTRLMRRLVESELAPVTLVTGEPAAGKTSLLVHLRESAIHGREVAWLTVPPRIVEDTTFWEYLLVSMAGFEMRVDDLRAALLDSEPPGEPWLATLANRLGRLRGRPVVVIDDLHEVESADVLQALERLVEMAPAGVSFVIATRRRPPWSLASWRLSGRMVEISSDDLRVTADEARQLLVARGVELGDADVEVLLQRTEGWLGGIQLALLSLASSPDPVEFLTRFAADDEILTTYLLRDVLAGQPEAVRDFLLETSILEVASAEICDAIRDRSDSAELLERCRASNLFLSRTGTGRRAYRLHGLIRELLHTRLNFDAPDRHEDLHGRASEYFEAVGDLEQALNHAAAAEDHGRVTQMVIAHAPQLAHRGRFDELRRMATMARAAGSQETSDSLLAVAAAWCFAGEADQSLRLLDEIDDRATEPGDLSSQLRAADHLVRGDVHLLAAIGRSLTAAARDRGPGEFGAAGYGLFVGGISTLFEGDATQALAMLEEADHLEHRPAPPAYIAIRSWAAYAATQLGALATAERLVDDALERREELSSGDTAAVATAYLASADLAWERNRLDEAAELYHRARRSVSPMPWQAILVECSRSRLSVSRGEPAQALEDLSEVGKLYLSGSGSALLTERVAASAFDACVRMGDVEAALAWEHTHAGTRTGALPWAGRIRLALLLADCDDDLLDRALAGEERLPEAIDTLLAAATALQCAGERDRARSAVARALALAGPERMIRRFVDAGPGVAAIVRDLTEDPRQADDEEFSRFFASEILDAGESTERRRSDPAPVIDELVVQLSARELDVLDLLAKGLSYTDMGTELFVSRNTIKSHVQHVYTKLGVASRARAVELGRSLGLI